MKKNVIRLFGEGKNRGILGEHTVEATDTEFVDKTDSGEQRTRISDLERIETNSDYAFIYISAISAHIIPRNNLLEGDCDLFLQDIKKRYDQAEQQEAAGT
jgi:hypothetical protein